MLAFLGIALLAGLIIHAIDDDEVDTKTEEEAGEKDPSPDGTIGDDLVFMDDHEDDSFDAGNGDDTIYASQDGDDTLYGAAGEDHLNRSDDWSVDHQSNGNELYGGSGNDTLQLGGEDLAFGGKDSDTFIASGNQSTIADFNANDDLLIFEVFEGQKYGLSQEMTEEGIRISVLPDDDSYSGHSVLLKNIFEPISKERIEIKRSLI